MKGMRTTVEGGVDEQGENVAHVRAQHGGPQLKDEYTQEVTGREGQLIESLEIICLLESQLISGEVCKQLLVKTVM